ncbi:hypothetical protein P389DRAFT_2535 [Cystobasidium minutum MCA 4210]|uniref:uncharacterized protein n=1 Tax=Cystobasidium minutum MCA 4210 TaxID=1397322 RepID=UPI0034CDDF19|eukprot:jgi/Rhomi1/2535/CE2534_699
MASLQREDSTSSRHSGFKQFIPPSAYAATTSSTASSPGQLPQDGLMGVKPRMSAHLSSALARGLNNVNGMLEGTTPVRLPHSASTVASAVWNKLPPAVQQLKNEIAWEWDLDDGSNSHRTVQATPERALSASPPQGARSLSTSAVELQPERSRDAQRPTSSASHASSSALSTRGSPATSGAATPGLAEPWQAMHPTSLRLADQLRLEYTNKQLNLRGPASSIPTTPPVPKGKQPYRPGYQPKNGVWRDRTDDFMDLRSRRSARGTGDANIMLHEERLLRRLEKLVDLHFPAPETDGSIAGDSKTTSENEKTPTEKSDPVAAIKASLSLKPGDMFGKVMRGIGRSGSSKTLSSSALRAADQAIVKWQNDSEVTNCPICGAPFNVVTRKHHCRLCGRVVCFLPPNANEAGTSATVKKTAADSGDETPQAIVPTRTARCSTFILYERYLATGSSQSLIGSPSSPSGFNNLLSTGSVREVDLGDYPPLQALASLTVQERDVIEAELDSKRAREVKAGVRVCRECLNTVMKRQKKSQPKRLEPWLKLYNALTELQQDIEVSLTLLTELRSVPEPTVDTVKQFNSSRKTLLKSLTSYDLLAKRIRDATAGSPLSPPLRSVNDAMAAAPSNAQPSSSQDRLQKAIYNKAMLFLGEKMALIKSMGGLSVKVQAPAAQGSALSQEENAKRQLQAKLEKEKDDKEQEERMARLAVLYEQEALVAGYLDDASARRQFEDAAALKSSLDDLRAEIQNLLR